MWCVLCVVVALLGLTGSEDLYWRPNTDWSNPGNWRLGRAPCEGDVADLSVVSVLIGLFIAYILIHVCVCVCVSDSSRVSDKAGPQYHRTQCDTASR